VSKLPGLRERPGNAGKAVLDRVRRFRAKSSMTVATRAAGLRWTARRSARRHEAFTGLRWRGSADHNGPTLTDGWLATLRQALAPHHLVVLLVDDAVPALERTVIEELLNDGHVPVILTCCDPPPPALTSWLDPVRPPRRPLQPHQGSAPRQ
jgi:hypothetical protein